MTEAEYTDKKGEILIVDDERIVRDSLKLLFESEGYSVREARNCSEAVTAVSESEPSLVLLDVTMPGESGFVACQKLRNISPLLPVVFLTGVDNDLNMARAFSVEADDFIGKLAASSTILLRVKHAIERAKAYRTALDKSGKTVELGKVAVNFQLRQVVRKRDNAIIAELSAKEADFLWLLASDLEQIFSYDEIIKTIGNSTESANEDYLYVLVSRLKRKLGRENLSIVNERGYGYRLVCIN